MKSTNSHFFKMVHSWLHIYYFQVCSLWNSEGRGGERTSQCAGAEKYCFSVSEVTRGSFRSRRGWEEEEEAVSL